MTAWPKQTPAVAARGQRERNMAFQRLCTLRAVLLIIAVVGVCIAPFASFYHEWQHELFCGDALARSGAIMLFEQPNGETSARASAGVWDRIWDRIVDVEFMTPPGGRRARFIDDRDLARHAAILRDLRHLRSLTIVSPKITDTSIRTIMANTRLESLSLCHTQITDEGLALLATSRTLRYLNLYGSVRVSGEALEAYAKSNPDVTILLPDLDGRESLLEPRE